MSEITTQQLKEAIHRFLDEQFQKKAEADIKKRDKALDAGDQVAAAEAEEKIAAVRAKYSVDNWLSNDALKLLGQLKFGSHLSKPVHPDSRGDNLYFLPQQTLPENLCASQSVPQQDYFLDSSGNAAAMPVAKFFDVVVDAETNTTLGSLLLADHPAVLHAFGSDEQQSEEYCRRFQAALNSVVKKPQTHERNKQILWPNGNRAVVDDDYICLVPLYPVALANYVYRYVGRVRFSDEAKAAKEARFKGKGEAVPYADVLGLAYIKLGGTKPQNISQVNSMQGGKHYLLPSMPPSYSVNTTHLSRSSKSFFNANLIRFCHEGRKMLDQVVQSPQNNLVIRERRDEALYAIVQQILVFAEHFRQQPAGWSDGYALDTAAQIYWLDPSHPRFADEDNIPERWQESVARDFARWLQGYLKRRFAKRRNDFADIEFDFWQQTFLEIIQAAGLVR